jgi:hypothetical protein
MKSAWQNGYSSRTNGGRDNGSVAARRNQLNDLTATEWIGETVSVWTQRGLGASHPEAQIERKHPAPFSFTDVSRLIRFFTKKGGLLSIHLLASAQRLRLAQSNIATESASNLIQNMWR